jgi:hypothetical protein
LAYADRSLGRLDLNNHSVPDTHVRRVLAHGGGPGGPRGIAEGDARRPVCWACQQFGGESPLCNLIEAKHE